MVHFHPKLIVLENDNTSMATFKEMVGEKLFGIQTSHKHSYYNRGRHPDLDKLKFYTFTGMEILDEHELSILENNTYLFVSKGTSLTVVNHYECR